MKITEEVNIEEENSNHSEDKSKEERRGMWKEVKEDSPNHSKDKSKGKEEEREVEKVLRGRNIRKIIFQ